MRSFSIALLLLLICSTSFANERYILSTEKLDQLKNSIHRNGGAVIKDLTNSKSVAANVSERTLTSLEREFGDSLFYEKDVVYSINRQPGGGPVAQPAQTLPWGIARIGSISAHLFSRGSGVTVCVVDTGVDLDHPDLKQNIVGGVNTINTRSSADDDNGHGTHVSGIIAAIDNAIGVIGVAPDAKIFAAKALNRQGTGWASDLAEGIYECINRGTRVVNMSWGSSSPSTTIYNAIVSAYNAGLVLVGAAGNEAASVIYPAAFSEVLAVSAIDSNMQLASFSNYGPEIDFTAPGVNINSTFKGDTYRILNGTSMASPHVAGVAALWISSGSLGLVGEDIGLSLWFQGAGLIDAYGTVNNF